MTHLHPASVGIISKPTLVFLFVSVVTHLEELRGLPKEGWEEGWGLYA